MLEILDLTKRYGPVVALDGASFTARPGRIVGFLGPNGAGKTTTMRCIFGLAPPDRGEVRWKGQPVDRDARLRFGYMPEQRGLYPRMRVAEQLSYFGQQHGMSGKAANAAAGRWLERMGLARPRQVQARGAVARQPAARPARDGARPRPRAARPRRAVLRPRPDRHRDDDRRRARAGGGRGRRRLLQPPARSRRGRLRGRRDHRPRPDRRRRAPSTSSRRRRAASTSRSRSPGRRATGSTATTTLHGARADRRQGQAAGRPRRRPRRPARPRPRGRRGPDVLLRAAEAVRAVHGGGRARTGGRDPGGGVMPRWRSIWLVARREILERGRSRGFILSVAFTTLIVVGSFVDPGDPVRRRQPDQGRHRRAVAARPAGRHRGSRRSASTTRSRSRPTPMPRPPTPRSTTAAPRSSSTMPADLSGPGEIRFQAAAGPGDRPGHRRGDRRAARPGRPRREQRRPGGARRRAAAARDAASLQAADRGRTRRSSWSPTSGRS